MSRIPLLKASQAWNCPNCDTTDMTAPLPPGSSRFHTCAGLHMLTAPIIRADPHAPGLTRRCKVEAEERADYLNGETQAMGDDGKAYMAVTTRYADGRNYLAVNAGLAHGSMRV